VRPIWALEDKEPGVSTMPVYEFQCLTCMVIHEHFIPFGLETADPIHCNEQMIKLFTPPAIHFKGSGFYQTDHKK
jgi:predicted nucleic acid-binding Zn ribbon protein